MPPDSKAIINEGALFGSPCPAIPKWYISHSANTWITCTCSTNFQCPIKPPIYVQGDPIKTYP